MSQNGDDFMNWFVKSKYFNQLQFLIANAHNDWEKEKK